MTDDNLQEGLQMDGRMDGWITQIMEKIGMWLHPGLLFSSSTPNPLHFSC